MYKFKLINSDKVRDSAREVEKTKSRVINVDTRHATKKRMAAKNTSCKSGKPLLLRAWLIFRRSYVEKGPSIFLAEISKADGRDENV